MTGAELRAIRNRMDVTQSYMAGLLGCSRAFINRMEQRATVPPMVELAARQVELSHSVSTVTNDAA